MPDLISRIRERIASEDGPLDELTASSADLPGPATPGDVAAAEAAIGRPLPSLLVRLYTEIAHGGFGPDYGLLGINGGTGNEGGHDAVAIYAAFRRPDKADPHWRWPAHLLPVVHCGCAMYLCVDLRADDAPVIWFEPNPHNPGRPWDDSFIPLKWNLEQLLSAWLDGEPWTDAIADDS